MACENDTCVVLEFALLCVLYVQSVFREQTIINLSGLRQYLEFQNLLFVPKHWKVLNTCYFLLQLIEILLTLVIDHS